MSLHLGLTFTLLTLLHLGSFITFKPSTPPSTMQTKKLYIQISNTYLLEFLIASRPTLYKCVVNVCIQR